MNKKGTVNSYCVIGTKCKIKYADKKRALTAINMFKGSEFYIGKLGGMNAYRCATCRCWHVGHSKPRRGKTS